jgi:hypothetical protein
LIGAEMDDAVFLYDQAVEQIVRLHAFRSTKPSDIGGKGDVHDDVDHVAELLAKRDLLTFSASLRNFAEAAKATDQMRAAAFPTYMLVDPPVPPYFIENGGKVTLYQALSRVIHSHTLRICRTSLDFFLFGPTTERQLFTAATQPQIPTDTVLLIETERDPLTVITLRALIASSCDFLNLVSEVIQRTERVLLPRDFR